MTKEEILKKAIEKAYKNGWLNGTIFDDILIKKVEQDIDQNGCGGYFHFDSPLTDITELSYINILFDHSFLKALFGEEMVCENNGNNITEDNCLMCDINNYCNSSMDGIPVWQYYGFKILKATDRLEYIKQFI